MALAASLTTSGKVLSDAQIESLAGNLPDTYSVSIENITALTAALLLICFDSTSPAQLNALISNGKLKVSTMDDSKKIYIGSTVFLRLLNFILDYFKSYNRYNSY